MNTSFTVARRNPTERTNCIVSLSKEIGGKRGWRNLNTQMRMLGKNHSHACKRKKVFISNARGKFILKSRLNDFIAEYKKTQYKFKFTIHM